MAWKIWQKPGKARWQKQEAGWSQSEIVADRNRKQNDQEVELGCKASCRWKLKIFWCNYCNIRQSRLQAKINERL